MIKWIVDKRHVGTHGPCVRSRRMKYKCTIIRADARAVRPYMPLACKAFFNRTNHKVQSSKFNVQSQGPYMRSSGSPYQPFTHQFGHEALPVHIENSRQLELF